MLKSNDNHRYNHFRNNYYYYKRKAIEWFLSKAYRYIIETLIFKYRNVSRTLSDEVLFLCQNTGKGGRCMLRDDILEKLFSNKEMQALPIGYQSVAVEVLNKVLEEIKEESPYVTVSDLLSSTDLYGL